MTPAAFGRLCVETSDIHPFIPPYLIPAAFGRLCVETFSRQQVKNRTDPAAFGRLCVETDSPEPGVAPRPDQPPSGGCVLKLGLLAYLY